MDPAIWTRAGADAGNGSVLKEWRRPHVVVTIAALLTLSPAHADWGPNLETFIHADDNRVVGGFEFLAPFWQDAWRLSFAELKVHVSDRRDQELNVGLGQRWLDENRGFIYGIFAQYDRRSTGWSNDFDQLTLGVESLGRIDLRLNYQHAFADAKRVHGWVNGIQFEGYRTFTQESYEEPLSGFDGEVGLLLPFQEVEARLYAGGYTLEGDLNGSAAGWKARLEVRPIKSLTLEVSYRDDAWFGGQAAVALRYAFGSKPERGVRTLSERMTQPTRRDLDVLVTPPETTPLQSVVLDHNTIHIDSIRSSAGADGSFEKPYRSIEQCRSGRCDSASGGAGGSGSLVRLWRGNSPRSAYDLAEPWRMSTGQTLWGEGWRIDPQPTRDPEYRNWMDRGRFVPGMAPKIVGAFGDGENNVAGVHALISGIVLGDGGRVSGVSVDVRGIADRDGRSAPAVLVDGAAEFTVQGNLLLTDAVGIEVRGLAASLEAAPAGAFGSPAIAVDEIAWTMPDGTPIQGRILDNLVLVPTPQDGEPLTGAAVALVNEASDGTEHRQVLVYKGGASQFAAYELDASMTPVDSIGMENRAVGDGSRAVQQLVLENPDLDLTGGIRLLNQASAGGEALQTLVVDGALRTSGLSIENRAVGSGSIAAQMVSLNGVRLTDPPFGSNGVEILNRADDGGTANQGVSLAGTVVDLSQTGILASNAAVGEGSSAVQQIEIKASGSSLRLDLLNEARTAATAIQQADISGLDFGNALADAQWVGVVNGAFDGATAAQDVRLADVGLDLAGPSGVSIGSGAYLDASATQTVRIQARGGSASWLGAFNQAAHGGESRQRVAASGFGVAGVSGNGGIEVVNGAFTDAVVHQVVDLDLAGIDLPDAALLQQNRAENGSDATQGLRLRLQSAAGIGAATIANDAAGGSTVRQLADLSFGDNMQIDRLRATNHADAYSSAGQQLALSGGTNGLLGDVTFANVAGGDGAASQLVDGSDLPLLGNRGNGRLAAANSAGERGTARQTIGLTTTAGRGAGSRVIAVANTADTDAHSHQQLLLTGADDPGTIGPIGLSNAAGNGAAASQLVEIEGLEVNAETAAAVEDDTQEVFGIVADNDATRGEAAQRLVIDTGGHSLSAQRLAVRNVGTGEGAAARQEVSLAGQGGSIRGLDVDNGASDQAGVDQRLDLIGPELALTSPYVGNSAEGSSAAAQRVVIDTPAVELPVDYAWRARNFADGADALQSVDIQVHGRLAAVPDDGLGLALDWLNQADNGGNAAQLLGLDTANLNLSGRGIDIANAANGGARAGQIAEIAVSDALGGLGDLTIDNAANGGSEADQAVRAAGLIASGRVGFENAATANSEAVQGLDLAVGLRNADVQGASRASGSGRSIQAVTLQTVEPSTITGIGLESHADSGGNALQSVQLAGLHQAGLDRTLPAAPALIAADAEAGTVNQVIALTDVRLAGTEHGLEILATATAGADITQQVTVRDAAIDGGDVGILIDPYAPVGGSVAQHLALWSTNADGRFEPGRIESLDELVGLTQTLHIDGVRQTIPRELVLPSGEIVLIGDIGYGNIGDGSNASGLFATDDRLFILPIWPIDRQEANFGDFLSSEAGGIVHGLNLPDTADLTLGARTYLDDLRQRRGDPLDGGFGLSINGLLSVDSQYD